MERAQFLLLIGGAVVWIGALMFIWLRPERSASSREADFTAWRHRTGKLSATFAEFVGSEQAPSFYMSRRDQSIAVTAFALLALLGTLMKWGLI
jgi:hypothetical protein